MKFLDRYKNKKRKRDNEPVPTDMMELDDLSSPAPTDEQPDAPSATHPSSTVEAEATEKEGKKTYRIFEFDMHGTRSPIANGTKPLIASDAAWEKAEKMFEQNGFGKMPSAKNSTPLRPHKGHQIYQFRSPAEKAAFLNCLRQAVAEEEKHQAGVSIGPDQEEGAAVTMSMR